MFFVFSPRLNRVCASIAAITLPGALTLASYAQKIGEVSASDATVQGSVTLSSNTLSISNGSAIKAGEHAASLRLTRGGELRVCPGTSLSVNASTNGNELMLGMSSGAIEADYPLPASADVIITPDFRILLSGPGRAKIALTSNARGDTCVRSTGEESYVLITELMGDQTYRVKANEQIFFPGGQIDKATTDLPISCGCPAPEPVKRAEVDPAKPQPNFGETNAVVAIGADTNPPNPEAPLPPSKPGQVNVQVDAPFVFHGDHPEPDVTVTLARVHMEKLPWPQVPAVNAQPPAPSNPISVATKTDQPQNPKRRGFFRKIGSFFVAIFKG